jgi:hypothetical protein
VTVVLSSCSLARRGAVMGRCNTSVSIPMILASGLSLVNEP